MRKLEPEKKISTYFKFLNCLIYQHDEYPELFEEIIDEIKKIRKENSSPLFNIKYVT